MKGVKGLHHTYECITWTVLELADLSLSVVGSPAIRARQLTKAPPGAASVHHLSAGFAAIVCWCDPLPVPALGARPAAGRTGVPGGPTQDTIHWRGWADVVLYHQLTIDWEDIQCKVRLR